MIINFFVDNIKEYMKEIIHHIEEYGSFDHIFSFSISFYMPKLIDRPNYLYFDIYLIKSLTTISLNFEYEDYLNTYKIMDSVVNYLEIANYLINKTNEDQVHIDKDETTNINILVYVKGYFVL